MARCTSVAETPNLSDLLTMIRADPKLPKKALGAG